MAEPLAPICYVFVYTSRMSMGFAHQACVPGTSTLGLARFYHLCTIVRSLPRYGHLACICLMIWHLPTGTAHAPSTIGYKDCLDTPIIFPLCYFFTFYCVLVLAWGIMETHRYTRRTHAGGASRQPGAGGPSLAVAARSRSPEPSTHGRALRLTNRSYVARGIYRSLASRRYWTNISCLGRNGGAGAPSRGGS